MFLDFRVHDVVLAGVLDVVVGADVVFFDVDDGADVAGVAGSWRARRLAGWQLAGLLRALLTAEEEL